MTSSLARVMVAPNGARKTKADHPLLPITIEETVETAKACFLEGAECLHAHVRDETGRHSLDEDRYRELLELMAKTVPEMDVQITTESAGIYSPKQQRELLMRLRPPAASVSIREMLADDDRIAARNIYHSSAESGTAIQHIAYSIQDIVQIRSAIDDGTIPPDHLQVILVMGAYDTNKPARYNNLSHLLEQYSQILPDTDFAICAFGQEETHILRWVLQLGGKVRVGFENNLYSIDGTLASDNAARVKEILVTP